MYWSADIYYYKYSVKRSDVTENPFEWLLGEKI